MGVISVIMTIFVLECHHKDDSLPVPRWLTKVTIGCCAKFACWKDYKCLCGRKIKPSREDQNYNMTEEKHCEDNETDDTITWKDICHILDAFFLRLYLIVIGSLTCLLLITLIAGYNSK